MTLKALEFYSGIGAFAQAAGRADIDVLGAFDQSAWANLAYRANYGHLPSHRNLDSIPLDQLPQADLWWMSPPCTPFSRRGKRQDEADNRAKSFLHLISFIALKKPRYILIENVEGFRGSAVQRHLLQTLEAQGYASSEFSLCPTMFGVPMLRPRIFIVASQDGPIMPPAVPSRAEPRLLSDFLFEQDTLYDCDPAILARYAPVINLVDPTAPGAYLICFTSGYYRCRRASGSLISTGSGRARFISPPEILGLLGFSPDFVLPEEISLEVAYKLVGNSVDVRAIDYLLKEVLHCQ